MFQTFISRHNSNFFSDKLVLTSVTPASSAPVLQTPKATSSTLYFDSLTVNEIGRAVQQECPRPISYAVFCLKKKKKRKYNIINKTHNNHTNTSYNKMNQINI